MKLRTKRAPHPGYCHTGGPPRARAAPGTKTKKDLAIEEREKRAKAKADGLKKIAAIERANTVAYANDETLRSAQTSSCGCKQSKAQGRSNRRTAPPSESPSELAAIGSDTEDIEFLSGESTDKEQPHKSDIRSIEGSEPPTDLEHTIKKKSKGKPNVRTMIEDLKKGDYEEDSSPQETPVIVRSKRLRTETVRISPYLWTCQLNLRCYTGAKRTSRCKETEDLARR